MMGKFVGSGCMAASLIGTFAAVEKDYAMASAYALSFLGIAGEIAGETAKTPDAFKAALFDKIFDLREDEIKKMEKIEKRG